MSKTNNRKLIEKIVLLAVCGVAIVVMTVLTLTSYFQWKNYYDTVMAGRENSKPVTLELTGITVRMDEGKEYFANGKAKPEKDDLYVEGSYTYGEEQFTERLSSSDFDMVVPDGFAQNGGTITVTAEELTASLSVTLTPVKLAELYALTDPFMVAYAAGSTFSTEGMTLQAKYNDGTIVEVGNSYVVETAGALANGTNKVTVSFTYKGETVKYDVPVTVSNSFSNGAIVSVVNDGDVTVTENQAFSTANVKLRATYESGNRLLLNASDYTITNASQTAMLGENVSLEIKTGNNVEYSAPLTVTAKTQAESATITGGTKNATTVTLAKDNALSVVKDSYGNSLADVHLYLRKDSTLQSKELNKLITLTVNGAINVADYDVELLDGGAYSEVVVRDVRLYEGANTIQVAFKTTGFVEVDWLEVRSTGKKVQPATVGEYVAIASSPTFTRTLLKGEGRSQMSIGEHYDMSGACTDGEYIYYTFKNNDKTCQIGKYSFVDDGLIARSSKIKLYDGEESWGNASGSLTYFKGKVVLTRADGKQLFFDPETLSQVDADPSLKLITLPAEDFTPSAKHPDGYYIYSFTYNEKMDRYAVAARTGIWNPYSYLYIFNGKGEILARKIPLATNESIASNNLWASEDFRMLSGTDNYILASYGKGINWNTPDTQQPKNCVVQVFDWDGNKLRQETFGGIIVAGSDRCQVTSAVEVDGALYIGASNHTGVNGGTVYKVAFNNMPKDVEIPANSYQVKNTSFVVSGDDKLIFQVSGYIADLTKEDLKLEYAKLDPWPWVYGELAFDIKIKNGSFTLTADISALEDTSLFHTDAGVQYQKYIFYLSKKTDESRVAVPVNPELTAFQHGELKVMPYSEYGSCALRLEVGELEDQPAQSGSYAVSATDYYMQDGKLMVKITGTVEGYTKANFEMTYSNFIGSTNSNGWANRALDFTFNVSGGNFTATADISSLTDKDNLANATDDSNIAAGNYQKYAVYFNLTTESGINRLEATSDTILVNNSMVMNTRYDWDYLLFKKVSVKETASTLTTEGGNVYYTATMNISEYDLADLQKVQITERAGSWTKSAVTDYVLTDNGNGTATLKINMTALNLKSATEYSFSFVCEGGAAIEQKSTRPAVANGRSEDEVLTAGELTCSFFSSWGALIFRVA